MHKNGCEIIILLIFFANIICHESQVVCRLYSIACNILP